MGRHGKDKKSPKEIKAPKAPKAPKLEKETKEAVSIETPDKVEAVKEPKTKKSKPSSVAKAGKKQTKGVAKALQRKLKKDTKKMLKGQCCGDSSSYSESSESDCSSENSYSSSSDCSTPCGPFPPTVVNPIFAAGFYNNTLLPIVPYDLIPIISSQFGGFLVDGGIRFPENGIYQVGFSLNTAPGTDSLPSGFMTLSLGSGSSFSSSTGGLNQLSYTGNGGQTISGSALVFVNDFDATRLNLGITSSDNNFTPIFSGSVSGAFAPHFWIYRLSSFPVLV